MQRTHTQFERQDCTLKGNKITSLSQNPSQASHSQGFVSLPHQTENHTNTQHGETYGLSAYTEQMSLREAISMGKIPATVPQAYFSTCQSSIVEHYGIKT